MKATAAQRIDRLEAKIDRLVELVERQAQGRVVSIDTERHAQAETSGRPEVSPVEDDDVIGVVDAAELALRSPATLRRWIDAGAPIGRFDLATRRYTCSRRQLRDYFVGRFGKAPPGLADA
jgi:hypothetical protein